MPETEATRQVNVGARTTCSPPGVGCDRPWFVCAVDRRCEPELGLRLREVPDATTPTAVS